MKKSIPTFLALLLLPVASITATAATDLQRAERMTLQEIYALPVPEVESIVLADVGPSCKNLLSVYTQGKDDPAQLSPAEFCAVQHYSGAGFGINKGLWLTDSTGSALSGTDWAYARVLDSALAKIKNEPPTVVYRGAARKDIAFTKPGQVVRLKGYTSTSVTQEVAEEFLDDRLMIIKVSSGKDILPYSNSGLEKELLLPRSTYVRFDRAEMKKMEIFTEEGPETRLVEIVYLTEVPKQ